MKILKRPPMDWTQEVTCSQCKALLLIEQQDVCRYSSNYYASCVLCGARLYLSSQTLPWYVKQNAKNDAHDSWDY